MQLCRYTKPLSGLSDYIALDTETTGLDRYKDKIIEIGMIEVRGNQIVDSFHSFINPERHIPAAASKVNHIYDEDVKDAPTYDQIAPVIAAKLQKKTVIAHNSYFDMSFIVNMLDERGFAGRINHVDTLYFSRCMVRGLENYKLGTLAAHFGIDPGDSHRAIDDARVCHELFQKLKALPEADGFAQKPVEYIRPENKPAQPEAQPIVKIRPFDLPGEMLSDYIAIDTETTGEISSEDRIVSIAILEVENDKVVNSFHTYINPERHIRASASNANHIHDKDVKDAPTYDQIAPVIAKLVLNRTVVAYHSWFDVAFIGKMLEYCGYSGSITYVEDCGVHGIDGDLRAPERALAAHECFQELKGNKVTRSQKVTGQKPNSSPRSKRKRPLALRWWYIAFALAFFPAGISLIAEGGTGAGVTSIVLGLVMLLFTVRQFSVRRKEKKQGK